jgi:hypothetical protein
MCNSSQRAARNRRQDDVEIATRARAAELHRHFARIELENWTAKQERRRRREARERRRQAKVLDSRVRMQQQRLRQRQLLAKEKEAETVCSGFGCSYDVTSFCSVTSSHYNVQTSRSIIHMFATL